ncbi:RHS repeat-associated core domain-containing protein [Agromyces aerolatus]|uniref:RHS repeat-associated core domain-containing protein n=1 Tax=Agromyces sp. LY-1074 TaxID=3074080 RepID=UPI0028600B21|nr:MULTISPECIES: RHS repeat-associated core domain-containing protein [unclassified Agromyces]MDR5699793.1 RHS repeat-associated core domain-containing protein [Agromyces sp. LY-1074]MDR5706089.1 RHS repeat-associated core domain-containing protein [Agromyces sp. LY-1358]
MSEEIAVRRGGSVRSWWGVALGGVVSAGLVLGGVSPSWAAASEGAGAGSPVVGAFGMGAGVQGTVDERSGAFSFEVPLGGVTLGWDSRGPGADSGRFGFGPRWSVSGVGFVDTEGGVRVVPARGVQGVRGVFEASDSVPSGLAGYEGDEVRFSQTAGVLPARADGVLGERAYAFVLRELGGLVSYFDANGDPVAKLDAHGGRVDWTWEPGHRLAQVVTETGVVTSLEWSDPDRVVVSAWAGGGAPRPVGAIELSGGRVAAVTDATGARTTVAYGPSGLVGSVGSASGAVTNLTWQPLPDGTAAVDRVVVTDPVTGEQVLERRWEATGGLASGWPAVSDAGAFTQGGAGAQASAGPGFETVVTDGMNRVVSAYDGAQLMTARETSTLLPSGERVLQRQAFSHPDEDGDVPGRMGRPTGIELTFTNDAGQTRTVAEGFVFDTYGRVTLTADGTRYTYNAANQPAQETTPEGATISTTYWPTGDRATLTTATHTTGFYWDDGTLLNDTHTTAASTETASYLTALTRESRSVGRVASDERARVSRPHTVYATHDRHGNTTELTTEDGTQTTRYTYTDYGTTTPIEASDTEPTTPEASRYPFLYAGEYTNPTGTQHLAARTFAPASMQFTTRDTLPLHTRYGYANANPITHIDPSGHFAMPDLVNGLVIGVVLAAASVYGAIAGGIGLAAGGTLLGTIATNAGSIAFSGLTLFAGGAGAAIAAFRYVDDHVTKFLDEETDQRLEYSEYALMGFGALTAIGSYVFAPKTLAKLAIRFSPDDDSVLSDVEHIALKSLLKNSTDDASKFIRGYKGVLKRLNGTEPLDGYQRKADVYLKSGLDYSFHPVVKLSTAHAQLDQLKAAYWRAFSTKFFGDTPPPDVIDAFVRRHVTKFKAVQDNVTSAVSLQTADWGPERTTMLQRWATRDDAFTTPTIDAIITAK